MKPAVAADLKALAARLRLARNAWGEGLRPWAAYLTGEGYPTTFDAVAAYETGRRMIPAGYVLMVHKMTGAPYEWLFTGAPTWAPAERVSRTRPADERAPKEARSRSRQKG